MNIVNKLTLRHLFLNKGRTLITITGITLSVAMVCCIAGFVFSLRDVMYRTIKETRGDYHIAYYGVTPETAESIADEDVFGSCYTQDYETEGLVAIYLRFENPGRDCMDIASEISGKYDMQGMSVNNELLALEGVIVHDNILMTFYVIGTIAIVIVVTGSVIVIANAFYISSSERVRQFGLLKSVGATKWQIGRSILFEAFILFFIAIPLGILLGFLIQAAVLFLVNGLLTEINKMSAVPMAFHVVFNPSVIYISVAIALLTVLISAWLPARRAAKTSPIDAIRQAKDIRIRSKQLKTSRLTQKLFGFEGTLAAKSLKRNKNKYRATVVSLTVSIVLFVSISSFIRVLNKGVNMVYGDIDFDVLVIAEGDLETLDKIDTAIKTIPDAEIARLQYISLYTQVPDDFYSNFAPKNMSGMTIKTQNGEDYYPQIIMHSVPDGEFAKFAPANQNNIGGVLINNTGALRYNGKIWEIVPYNYKPDTKLPAGFWDHENSIFKTLETITVVAETQKIPETIPVELFSGACVNILIPESVFRNFFTAHEIKERLYTQYMVTTGDPDAFCETAKELLAPFITAEGDRLIIQNITQIKRLNNNITTIVMLFGYGFIAMLSLIAVTSVVATISTGMALRTQEFAMLYSAGMTSNGMNKMLNLESLMYGLKSIFIGLPIGSAVSYLIYMGMANMAEFAYQPPWTAMIISVAAIMLLTFGTMRYGKNKLKKVSIVEAIRSETI